MAGRPEEPSTTALRLRSIVVLLPALLCAGAFGQRPTVRLELIPPSPVTDRITLDMRGAVENDSDVGLQYSVALYLDGESRDARVYFQKLNVAAHASAGVSFRRSTANWAGWHRILLIASWPGGQVRTERTLQVLHSDARSTRRIDGAWVGIAHWSEEEGRYWNRDLRRLTEADWRQQILGMHALGMDAVVIQETFRNQAYYGRNDIATAGYHGLAYYPSNLFPGRAEIRAHDPIEAILSEADQLQMHVFLGVGMYAWFDFSPASLAWHKKVAAELWQRYGRHPSFYGWYVSEEVYGSLVPDQGELAKEQYRREIVGFFREFQGYVRTLAPEKPVMLAPNAFGLIESKDVWPRVLRYLDIVCPFGFQRMPPGDLSGEEAAELWQAIADQAGAHLWMDMEAFDFQGKALVPRPIGGLVQDLRRFPNFEKILCYQYPGMFNAPDARIKPGGPPTVVLYRDYQRYVENWSRAEKDSSGKPH